LYYKFYILTVIFQILLQRFFPQFPPPADLCSENLNVIKMKLYIPCNYRPLLAPETMEQAIKMLKIIFQEELSSKLDLRRVTAPLQLSPAIGSRNNGAGD